MALDTTVKYFHSLMSGAPTLNGTAGSMLAVLDACLVNGFGSVTVDSLVVASGVATLTRAAGLSFEKDVVLLVAGATPGALNGEKRALSVSSTTATFDATGVADGAATGTITVKLAPAGWEKQHSGTNLAAYRSLSVSSNKPVVRVDDSAGRVARVVGYESMADINSGTNPFPTAVQQSGGGYWPKSNAADATSRRWIVVGDGRLFYMLSGHVNSTPDGFSCHCFGEHVSFKPADAFPGNLCFDISDLSGNTAPGGQGNSVFSANNTSYLQRDSGGVALSTVGMLTPLQAGTASLTSGASGFPSYPSPVHGSVLATKMFVREGTTIAGAEYRGELPGAVFLCTSFASGVLPSRSKFVGEGYLLNRILLCVEFGSSGANRSMFDILGPWR